MKLLRFLLCLLLIQPLFSSAQTEEKPRYAPGKEKHRNKTDELGQKQGPWRTYNSLGDLTNEVEYVNDVRHGMSRRYYPYAKVMEEQQYQNGIKEGTYKRYYYSGTVKQEGEYLAGKKLDLLPPNRQYHSNMYESEKSPRMETRIPPVIRPRYGLSKSDVLKNNGA